MKQWLYKDLVNVGEGKEARVRRYQHYELGKEG